MPQKSSIPRSLRRQSTDAEKRVWHFLRNRQLGGWKFRRQVWIDRYIVDFVCLDAKLVVELDDIVAHLELRKCCARQASLVSG
ncbi:DUF559 domain-containing protein [Roseibium sp. AS2]|uniref:endonuclease domain-containing protein n=1 Tax=Roseibium sp. AS2 TaxID=3135781 RepID=UPI00316B25B8